MFPLQLPETTQNKLKATSLDPLQKSVTCTHHDTIEQQYRFRFAPEMRAFWLNLLPYVEANYRKITRFKACGSEAFIEYSASTEQFRLRSNHCGNRICPACRRAYAAKLARKVASAFQQNRSRTLKFLTLTLKPSRAPLEDTLRHLRGFFRRLRQTPLWKRSVSYGIAAIEVTRGTNNSHWHAHLHVLLHSEFMPQQQLSRLWKLITRGSFIVDIRPVKSTDKVAEYITNYVTKPPESSVIASNKLATEWYAALNGQHWIVRFGKRINAPKETEATKPTDWTFVCSLQQLLTEFPNVPPTAAAKLHFAALQLAKQAKVLDHVFSSA